MGNPTHQTQQNRDSRLPFQRLLENNDLGIIENPLQRIEEDELDEDIGDFYRNYGLEDVVDLEILLRGGRLARVGEEVFVAEEVMTEVEKAALAREKKNTAAIVGANQHWPSEFNLHIDSNDPTHTRQKPMITGDTWKFGAVNSIVYFAASIVGAFLCDPLTEIFVGRRGALFVAAAVTLAASIGSAFTHSWRALFACRFLLGIGMGAKSSVVPVYESEVSPARLRGQILTSWQTGTSLGIAICAAVNLIVSQSWRFQISSSFIPAAILLVLVFVGSESPRWLAKKQRYAEAYKVILRLRENPLLAARDLILIRAQLDVETILFQRKADEDIELGNEIPHMDPELYKREISVFGYGRRIIQLFTIPRARRSAFASFIVMTSQQFSGINIFSFLAATIFTSAGFSESSSLWLFFGFGAANFIFSPIAYFFIDRKGRRFLLMLSLAAMAPLLLATGFAFDVHNKHAQLGVVATFLILFTAAYSPGAGVVPFLYSSEVFPQVLREVGMAWASSVNFMGAGLLDLTVPQLSITLNPVRLLCLFAGLDAIALVFVWLFVPGTERQIATMEEMSYVFGVTTRRHVQYQIREVLPWYFNRYVRRHKLKDMDDLPPLYRYARIRNIRAEAQSTANDARLSL